MVGVSCQGVRFVTRGAANAVPANSACLQGGFCSHEGSMDSGRLRITRRGPSECTSQRATIGHSSWSRSSDRRRGRSTVVEDRRGSRQHLTSER